MPSNKLFHVVALVLLALVAEACRAAESWADPALPVQDGLEVWLDAVRQNRARIDIKLPTISDRAKLDRWLDSSGNKRHLIQPEADRQPNYFVDTERAAVRFDGRKQWLSLAGINQSFEESTVFIVTVPFSNSGGFRAFAAVNAKNQNDFTSGWTLDMGPARSERLEAINPEGIGFGGARNLLTEPDEFGVVQRLCMTTEVGSEGTRLFLNGRLQGTRERAPSEIQMHRLTVGARFYNFGAAPIAQGFLEGEISEVLVYSRLLSEDERKQVDGYLAKKHGDRRKIPIPQRPGLGKRLVRVVDPPAVQMFLPGFVVLSMPVELPNINNLRYRPDGKLVALGYNGNIYLLSDRDGDGLEEHVEIFFENKGELRSPIGMALTPPNYARGQGVFVASKGKCSLILDSNADDKADEEIVIASGWKELPHNVDALGVAVDPRDGSVYFGLGTENFTNPYLVDPATGKHRYTLSDEHGTIQRVAPDFKKRETVCTGIRFPVGLAFNTTGDLFCTDQEGATWLSNGNPFDELLHIESGRHYGFPPRHPKYLPEVIDEPSTFDYRPQHQSTCGICFNPVDSNEKAFGPESWRGDAFVCGYSRGKLYRTSLVKTSSGYVAQNQLIASVNSLLVEACITPAGDMVLATHSGAPDWGSGPKGPGKLYKVRYSNPDSPQPVQVWSQGPYEIRIAFDRPLRDVDAKTASLPFQTTSQAGPRATIEFGAAAGAGDRYESLRPGYQVVQDQLDTPRFELPVHSIQLLPDSRTMILSTAEMTRPVPHAIALTGLGRMPSKPAPNELRQDAAIDLQMDLCGVQAKWKSTGGNEVWSGWLPHLDLQISKSFTAHTRTLEPLWAQATEPGNLVLRTQLQLRDMLRPAVQPGSRIDYNWPDEEVTVHFLADRKFDLRSRAAAVMLTEVPDGFEATLTVAPQPNAWIDVELSIPTGDRIPSVHVSWSTKEDARRRALPLNRMFLPWAKSEDGKPMQRREHPQLAGGNWSRGRKLFFDDQVGCGKCHQFAGEGASIGPALTNLPLRDYESVLRDITQPSVSFNPDYLPYSIALKDGRVLAGTVRSERDILHVGASNATVTKIRQDEIEEMSASSVSIMPEGIVKQLGNERLKDLLTFLLTPPPSLTDYGPLDPPSPRTQAEVDAVLAGAPEAKPSNRPIEIVLVAGRKDHGPGEHDYPAWQKVWQQLLSMADEVQVSTAMDWPSPDQLKSANVLVFYQQGRWTPDRARDLDAYFARGGGAVYLHYAVDGGADPAGMAERIGLAWQGGRSAFRHGPLDVVFPSGLDHPIARNFDNVHFHDESYWRLVGKPDQVQVLATGVEESQPQPLFWTFEPGKGRVFVSILGHFSWTFDDPLFRVLVLRGIAWSAGEPVDRFNRLATLGARVQN